MFRFLEIVALKVSKKLLIIS